MLWSYLLIALVLFVNLLIAMFSKSYEHVMAKADENWKMMRVLQVQSYITAHAATLTLTLTRTRTRTRTLTLTR